MKSIRITDLKTYLVNANRSDSTVSVLLGRGNGSFQSQTTWSVGAGVIAVAAADGNIATGLTKFGAIVGDRTEIGCNAVINPGSILGRDCIIYPGANFRGVLPHASILKVRQEQQILTRHDKREG